MLLCWADAALPSNPDANWQFMRGLDLYRDGSFEAARVAFESCIRLDRTRTDCMTNLGSVLIDLGGEDNDARAEELYRMVLAIEPAHSDAAFNLALQLQDRKTNDALREAATLYLEVVAADPKRWDAWANLGTALAEVRDRPLQATRAFQRAILELERMHEASEGEPAEESDDATYLAELYYNFGIQLSGLSDEQCATYAAEPTSLLMGVEPGDASSAVSSSVCLENAQNALRNALQLAPEHAQAEHMLAAMLADSSSGGAGGGGVKKASPQFVKSLFDDFSDSFNEKLATLGYVVPRLLGEAVAAHVRSVRGGAPFATALDAGCGTGLAGPYLRTLVSGYLTGVDLSPKMLTKAEALMTEDGSPVYDKVLAADLVTLQRADVLERRMQGNHRASMRRQQAAARAVDEQSGVELLAAADVLVYFGDLSDVLAAFSRLSAVSGVALVFSCERADEEEAPAGWRLRTSGRFAHTKAYVVATAAATGNFELIAYEEITPRMENGVPVQGHLFTFAR